MSEDGSHIYFGSPRRLTPDAARGATNLYVWSDEDSSGVPSPDGAAAGTTKFIGAITDGGIQRVSRTGRYMLFVSHNSLRGATNNGKQAIYLYDDVTGELACASCRPNGTPSARDSNLADVPEALSPSYGLVPRNIDDEGRVYFNSSDKLVPADQTFSQDVYEYDNGRTYLLTAGQGDENPSYVADNSDDGSHVFFLALGAPAAGQRRRRTRPLRRSHQRRPADSETDSADLRRRSLPHGDLAETRGSGADDAELHRRRQHETEAGAAETPPPQEAPPQEEAPQEARERGASR